MVSGVPDIEHMVSKKGSILEPCFDPLYHLCIICVEYSLITRYKLAITDLGWIRGGQKGSKVGSVGWPF